MRVITSVEAIHRRYGPVNEQFYVWLQVPRDIFNGGISLVTLAIFISSVFGTSMEGTILTVGVIVIIVTTLGGAGCGGRRFFVQMMVMMLAASVAAFLALHQPAIGGISGFLDKLPESHMSWTILARPTGGNLLDSGLLC